MKIVLKSEKGVIHLLFLIILVIGLAAGSYVFRNQFHFLTRAESSTSPIFRSSSVAGAGAVKVSSVTINKPAGVINGDVLIAQVVTYVGSVNVATPSGWTLVSKNTGPNGAQPTSSIYTKWASNEPSSYTWNFDVATYAGADMISYYNASPLITPYEFNYGSQNSNQVTAQGITTSVDNEMLVYFGTINGTGIIGNPTGMTQRIGGNAGPEVSDQVISPAGSTGTRTGVVPSSGNNIGQLLAIQPIPVVLPSPTPVPTPLPTPAPTAPPITFRDKSTSAIGNNTSVTVNKPANVQNDDLMLAQVVLFNNPTATVTPPSGWSLVRSSQTSNFRSILYWKKANQNESTSYSWTLSTSAIGGGGIVSYANAANPAGSAPYDSNSSSQNSSQVVANGVTTYIPNEMLVYFGMIAASTTITAPTGMTERYGGNFESADQIIPNITGPTTTGQKIGVAGVSGANAGQLIALMPTGGARSPMDSGTLTETATNAGCGVADLNCTEHVFNVDCQNIPTRQITVREYANTTSPKKGAVIFTTGVEGNIFYSNLDSSTLSGWNQAYDNPKQTRIQTQQNGFKAYELAWTDQGGNGWKTNTSSNGDGLRKATCGYAAAVKWISQNEGGTSSVLCAQGNSAGGMQIAYGLSYYGLGPYLDMAIVSGGPPYTRPETGHGTATCNDGQNYATRFEDFVMGWQGNGDYIAKDCGDTGFTRSPMPASAVRALATQGITPNPSDSAMVSYQGIYTYPQTRINFIEGQTDPVGASAQNYINQILSQNSNPGAAEQFTTQYPTLPTGGDYAHLVDQYDQGAGIIRNLIQNECHSWQ